MSAFLLEKELPSVLVTKDLIESLEKHLIAKIASFAQTKEGTKPSIKIVVVDGHGEEVFESSEQMYSAKFPDSTKRIEVEAKTHWNNDRPEVRFALTFSQSIIFSSISIRVTGSNAREFATGLMETTFRVLEPHHTLHWLFHNPLLLILSWGALLGLPWIRDWLPPMAEVTIASTLSWILIFVYLFIAKPRYPYCTFESQRWERTSRFTNWLVYGLLTFLVFGTLFTFARRFLVGF